MNNVKRNPGDSETPFKDHLRVFQLERHGSEFPDAGSCMLYHFESQVKKSLSRRLVAH